jgi:hypothetical protein
MNVLNVVRCASATVTILAVATAARAQFTENFTPTGPNNEVAYLASPLYVASDYAAGGDVNGNPFNNAFIITATGGDVGFDGEIPNAAPGSAFFLFDGTSAGRDYAGTVWQVDSPIAVLADTEYTFSFYLTNADDITPASIQPFVDGSNVGGPVSAAGDFTDGIPGDQWQKFSVNWFSGALTTANFGLQDLTSTGIGNDFGIDNISFAKAAAAPDAPTASLVASGILCAGVAAVRRRHKDNCRTA